MRNPFARRKATASQQAPARRGPSEAAVRRHFMAAARQEFPTWFVLGEQDGCWERQLSDWRRTFASKHLDADPLAALDCVIKHWPGGALGYNAWYASGNAVDMGILDGQYRPRERAAGPINEEARRRAELVALGGSVALNAYLDAIE